MAADDVDKTQNTQITGVPNIDEAGGTVDEENNPKPETDGMGGERFTLDGKRLRTQQRVDYKTLHHGTALMGTSSKQISTLEDKSGVVLVTPQMNFKQGLKTFRHRGELAVRSELKQVHDMKGVKPQYKNELPALDRAQALRYLMYLKERNAMGLSRPGAAPIGTNNDFGPTRRMPVHQQCHCGLSFSPA